MEENKTKEELQTVELSLNMECVALLKQISELTGLSTEEAFNQFAKNLWAMYMKAIKQEEEDMKDNDVETKVVRPSRPVLSFNEFLMRLNEAYDIKYGEIAREHRRMRTIQASNDSTTETPDTPSIDSPV